MHSCVSSGQQALENLLLQGLKDALQTVPLAALGCSEKDAELLKWKRLALGSQRALREAQQAERQSQRAAHKAAAEAKVLEGQLAQLQHELRAKVRGEQAQTACRRGAAFWAAEGPGTLSVTAPAGTSGG